MIPTQTDPAGATPAAATPASNSDASTGPTPATSPTGSGTTNPPGTKAAAKGSSRRAHYFRLMGALLLLLGLASLTRYWYTARGVETTDDAYVMGDTVQVSAQIEGTATTVLVQNTDRIAAGAPLLTLDQADARLSLDEAIGRLAHAVREYRAARADAQHESAEVALKTSDANRAADDLQRRLSLAQDGGVPMEEVRHARETVTSSRAALDAQLASYAASVAHTDGTDVYSNPLVSAAAVQVRSAALTLRRTEIRAPLAGLVTHRVIQVGEHVTPGTPLLSIVPLDAVWVEANFKESQLEHFHSGQAVELHADMYGDDLLYHGTIKGIEAATGAASAAIPAQNATGNWIKVVQRIPVRIVLNPAELQAHPLRIGMSLSVKVRNQQGAHDDTALAVANASPQPIDTPRTVDTTHIFEDDFKVGTDLVNRVIQSNSGTPSVHSKSVSPGT